MDFQCVVLGAHELDSDVCRCISILALNSVFLVFSVQLSMYFKIIYWIYMSVCDNAKVLIYSSFSFFFGNYKLALVVCKSASGIN